MRRRTVILFLVALSVWIGGYLAWRASHSEVWARDGRTYVLFPERGPGRAVYYLWRPLSVADAALTGVQTHIGPHRDATMEADIVTI